MNLLLITHMDWQGVGPWEEVCRQGGISVEVVALHRGGSLPPPGRCEAVISLGGPMSVDAQEAHALLSEEEALIRRALAESVPFLGMGVGGQLLAKAMGGRVWLRKDRLRAPVPSRSDARHGGSVDT